MHTGVAMKASGLSLTLLSYMCMGMCSWTSASAAAPASPIWFSLRTIVVTEAFTFSASDAMSLNVYNKVSDVWLSGIMHDKIHRTRRASNVTIW